MHSRIDNDYLPPWLLARHLVERLFQPRRKIIFRRKPQLDLYAIGIDIAEIVRDLFRVGNLEALPGYGHSFREKRIRQN